MFGKSTLSSMKFLFPYTYSNTVELPTDYIADCENLILCTANHIYNSQFVADLEVIGDKIVCEYIALFNIKYPVKIRIETSANISIIYEVNLLKLIQISIILVLLTAFFSSFGMSGFLWFSLGLLVAFNLVNFLFVDSGIQKLIKSTDYYKALFTEEQEEFTEEQKQWMNDISKCPACGENLQIFDKFCPECGLRLPHPSFLKHFDISKYQNTKIRYHYKQKKQK